MHKPQVKKVPVNLLFVDLAVQRPLDDKRANNISTDLNLDAIGTICVSLRGDGNYHIIDGQHRVEALRISGLVLATDTLLCEVFEGLTPAEEAAMFRLRNNTQRPQVLDRFRVRLIEGDPTACAVMDILKVHGWALPAQPGRPKGRYSAVLALERLYTADPESQPNTAERVIAAVTTAWGHVTEAGDGQVVDGIGRVLLRYGVAVDQDSLIARLRSFPGGPRELLAKGRGWKATIGCSVGSAIAELVVELYNKNRRSRAIAAWRSA